MCPICHDRRVVGFFEKPPNSLLICEMCRHIFWSRFPAQEELDAYYRGQYTSTHHQERIQEENRGYYRNHCRELLERCSASQRSDASLLDYGCSIPVILDVARTSGFAHVIGVDPSEEARQYARERGFEVILPSELDRIPDNSVDVARFVHVLEHTIDPTAVLVSVVRKVKPGGIIHIAQPSFPVFIAAPSASDLLNTVYPEHLHFFSPISLVAMVESAGLKVLQIFTFHQEEQMLERHAASVDQAYSRDRMVMYSTLGERCYPKNANYPVYAGENSAVWASKAVSAKDSVIAHRWSAANGSAK